MTTTFSEKVYAAVRKIPEGKVATYRQIATMAGSPNAARAVGGALHKILMRAMSRATAW